MTKNADGDHLDDAEEEREATDPNLYDLTGLESAGAFAAAVDPTGALQFLGVQTDRLNEAQLNSWQYLAGSMVKGGPPLPRSSES